MIIPSVSTGKGQSIYAKDNGMPKQKVRNNAVIDITHHKAGTGPYNGGVHDKQLPEEPSAIDLVLRVSSVLSKCNPML